MEKQRHRQAVGLTRQPAALVGRRWHLPTKWGALNAIKYENLFLFRRSNKRQPSTLIYESGWRRVPNDERHAAGATGCQFIWVIHRRWVGEQACRWMLSVWRALTARQHPQPPQLAQPPKLMEQHEALEVVSSSWWQCTSDWLTTRRQGNNMSSV